MKSYFSKQYKIILLGDSGVGKTSIVNRYIKGEYDEKSLATIGVEIQQLFLTNGNERIKFNIWDTSGQEKYHSLAPQYYRNIDGVILVYDITRISSLQNLKDFWIHQLFKYAQNQYHMVIVGNKLDLKNECDSNNLVATEMGQKIARAYSTIFVEASAKTGEHVQNAFDEFINRIISDNIEIPQEKNVDLRITEESDGGFASCC